MTEHEVMTGYFRWLTSFVANDCLHRYSIESYHDLLYRLFLTPFSYRNPMDENRYYDGIELRYEYGRDAGLEDPIIAQMDREDCSILEMLVAVSIRFDNEIIAHGEDRTGEFFWDALENLKLTSMSDDSYDDEYVGMILHVLNESGVVFDVPEEGYLASYDIWWQFNRHLVRKEGV